MTGDILDSIDGALRDWTVSRDAMRWTPEPSPADEPEPPQAPGPWSSLRDATIVLSRPFALQSSGILHGDGTRRDELPCLSAGITGLADFSGSLTGPLFPGAAERLLGSPVPGPASTGQPLADFGRALGETFRSLVEWAAKMLHDVHLLFFPARHGRCLRCHPERKPKPLAVDGHEYRRRLAARRRRRRRHGR